MLQLTFYPSQQWYQELHRWIYFIALYFLDCCKPSLGLSFHFEVRIFLWSFTYSNFSEQLIVFQFLHPSFNNRFSDSILTCSPQNHVFNILTHLLLEIFLLFDWRITGGKMNLLRIMPFQIRIIIIHRSFLSFNE